MDLLLALTTIVIIAFATALAVVGIPGILLKLGVRSSMRETAGLDRRMLIRRSILATSIAGFLGTLMFLFASKLNDFPLLVGISMSEFAVALTLIFSVAVLDTMAWRRSAIGPAPLALALRWLVGSNLWVLWAIFLVFSFESQVLFSDCYMLAEIKGAEEKESACRSSPRFFWTANPELHQKMRAIPISD